MTGSTRWARELVWPKPSTLSDGSAICGKSTKLQASANSEERLRGQCPGFAPPPTGFAVELQVTVADNASETQWICNEEAARESSEAALTLRPAYDTKLPAGRRGYAGAGTCASRGQPCEHILAEPVAPGTLPSKLVCKAIESLESHQHLVLFVATRQGYGTRRLERAGLNLRSPGLAQMASEVLSAALQPQEVHGGLQAMPQPADIHVLLVDDEKLSRTVVGNLLRKCNYKGALRKACALPLACYSRLLVSFTSSHRKLSQRQPQPD